MFGKFFAAIAAMAGASVAFAQAASAPIAVTVSAAEVGFFAGLFGFIAGWALVILAVLAVFGILSEHNDSRGWSVFWLLLAGAVAFVAFNVSLVMLAVGSVAYIVIGLFWSFWRYKRHASKMVAKHKESDARERERVIRELHPKAMLGTITAWIMVWPFSMVENILGDLLTGIQMLVTKFFRGVYHKVYDAAVAALK